MAAAKVVHCFGHLLVHSQPTCSYNTVCLVKKANQLQYLLRRLEWARLCSSILTSFYRCAVQKQHPHPLQCGAAAVAGRLSGEVHSADRWQQRTHH